MEQEHAMDLKQVLAPGLTVKEAAGRKLPTNKLNHLFIGEIKMSSNVMTTVKEFEEPSFRYVISSMGGVVFWVIAFTGILLILYKKKEEV